MSKAAKNIESQKRELITVKNAEINHSFFSFKELKETKAASTDKNLFSFSGYGSVYHSSDDGGDVMEPGCFDTSLALLKPELLWQHKDDEPIGVWDKIVSDEYGLNLHGLLPKDDTFVSGRVIPQVRIGSIRGLSIGFITQEYFIDEDGRRHVTICRLLEVSLVGQPKHTATTITEFKNLLNISDKDSNKKETKKLNNKNDEDEVVDNYSAYLSQMQSITSDLLREARATKLLME